MLTPDYLSTLPEGVIPIWQGVEDFIIRDIARRLKKMDGITGTAELQRIALSGIGKDINDIDKRIAEALNLTQKQVTEMFDEAMQVNAEDVIETAQKANIPVDTTNAQRITKAAVSAANGDISNLTQTMGYLNRSGQFTMWTAAYKRALSLATMQVASGAVDYSTAVRMTLNQFTDNGLVVEYASGVHRSLEAALRQNILSGVSRAANKVLEDNAKQIGADGWEISAHADCAPDHEPIQGRQYTAEDYEELNNSLARPIGALNCRHIAYPIIMGVSEPAYSENELNEMARKNAEGITYEGKHYTGYEATQMQRKLERALRKTKRELIGADESGDKDMFTAKSIKLRRLREYYKDFSTKAGLPMQNERAQVTGFGRSISGKAIYSGGNAFTNTPKNGIIKLNRMVDDNGDLKFKYVANDAIQKLSTSEEIKKFFEWDDEWGDTNSPIDGSLSKLRIETQKEIAEGLAYAQKQYGLNGINYTVKAGKLKSTTCGEINYQDRTITFNLNLDKNAFNAFQTAVHEMTHYADHLNGDIAPSVYKTALKNLGLKSNSKEAFNLSYDIALDNAGDPAEVIAYSADKYATNAGNKLSNEIVKILGGVFKK